MRSQCSVNHPGHHAGCGRPEDGAVWTAKTVKRPRHIQHSPGTPTTGLRKRGNNTSRSTSRSGRQNAATRRNMQREERVTVQGLVKKQQPHGMSHRGGVAAAGPHGQALVAGSRPSALSFHSHRTAGPTPLLRTALLAMGGGDGVHCGGDRYGPVGPGECAIQMVEGRSVAPARKRYYGCADVLPRPVRYA